MKDEKRFIKDGKVYVAVAQKWCAGCAFYSNREEACSNVDRISCSKLDRADKTSVIWKLESEVDRPCVGGAASIRDVLPDVYGRKAWAKRFKELQEEQRATKLEPVKHFCAKLWKDGER